MSERRGSSAGAARASGTDDASLRVPERFMVGISRFDPDRDAEDLAAFQLRMYGAGSRQVDPARAAWLFEHNPYRDPAEPGLWVCRRDGAIVGQQAEIPFELQVGHDRRRAAWAIDLMVDPPWRLRGVGPGLIVTQLREHTIVGGLNISDKGQAAYTKVGLSDLGIVPVYLRPLDARRVLRLAPVAARLRLMAPVAGPGLRAADALAGGTFRSTGLRLVAADRLDQRTDEVWERSSHHYPVLARRDLAALAWRIDQRPDRDLLQRYYLVRRGQALGQVVLRPTTWSDEPVVVVVDYLAPPRWVAPLLLLAGWRAARRSGAVALLAKTRNEAADRRLRRAGFLRREQGADPPIRFMVRCSDEPGICALVEDPDSWFVTAADSDLEYATTPGHGQEPGTGPDPDVAADRADPGAGVATANGDAPGSGAGAAAGGATTEAEAEAGRTDER